MVRRTRPRRQALRACAGNDGDVVGRISSKKAGYFAGFFCRRATTPFSLRELRLTRASTKRSRIWTMTPRCFLTIGGIGPRRVGGDIFSNVKTGIVYPLVVELKHSWISPELLLDGLPVTANRSIPSNAGTIIQAQL